MKITPERLQYIKSRVAQARHVPCGLAMSDVERAEMFAMLDECVSAIDEHNAKMESLAQAEHNAKMESLAQAALKL